MPSKLRKQKQEILDILGKDWTTQDLDFEQCIYRSFVDYEAEIICSNKKNSKPSVFVWQRNPCDRIVQRYTNVPIERIKCVCDDIVERYNNKKAPDVEQEIQCCSTSEHKLTNKQTNERTDKLTNERSNKETQLSNEGNGSLLSHECNGYKNHLTWLVSVWMSNDQGSYRYWRFVARESQSINALADAMKDEFSEGAPVQTGLYGDLMAAVLEQVDWHEISVEWWNEEHKEA